MSRIIIQLRVCGEPRQRIWLRKGQVIEIGSSDSADISIPDDPFVEPIHLAMAHQTMGCFCECLVETAEMRVNESKFQRKRLKDRDVVVIGNSALEISIEPEPKAQDGLQMPPVRKPSGTVSGSFGQSPIVAGGSPDFAFGQSTPFGTGGVPADNPPAPTMSSPIAPGPADEVVTEVPKKAAPAKKTSSKAANSKNVSKAKASDPPVERSDSQETEQTYRAEKLAAEVWRYSADAQSTLTLDTVIGRLAELFKIFLLVPPATAARLLSQGKYISQMQEININLTLIESPTVSSATELLRNPKTNDEIMLFASNSSIDDLAQNVLANAVSFGRPSIFSMQVSVATQGMADEIMMGKIAVVLWGDHGWEFYSTVDPATEHRFLGFDRPPIDWEQG